MWREKSKSQIQIERFMVLAHQELPERPAIPSEEVRLLRARLILEEALETINRGLGVGVYLGDQPDVAVPVTMSDAIFEIDGPVNMVELADGCADVEVVTKGTLSAFGIADESVQAEVNDANLRKFGPGGRKCPDTGKWLKPPDFQPPDIARVLREQGYVENG